MASESTEGGSVSVVLPPELHDWLEEQAAELGVDTGQLLAQLVASYRVTAEADLEAELDEQIESTVQSMLTDTLTEQLGTTVQEAAEPLVTERVNEATTAVQSQLTDRIDTVEGEFQAKLEDVRERVIQVKKETDGKAPDDHTHEALEDIAALEEQIVTMEEVLRELQTEIDETVPEHAAHIDGLEDRVLEIEDRLQTVAWVVSDLREAHESGNGLQAVERIKRAAAKANIKRATCESCGDGVTLSLLTDPECPHCSATVTNVEPNPGWFRKPKLRVASQLESGESE
jgi:chromosome segregation ATPase